MCERMHSFVMRGSIDETGFFADRKCVFVLKKISLGGFPPRPAFCLRCDCVRNGRAENMISQAKKGI